MTSSHPIPAPCQWFARLASVLDRRSAPRLALLFLGAVLARGRWTVTAWIRAARLGAQYRPCYTIAAAGRRTDRIARRLLTEVVWPLVKGAGRLTLALDDKSDDSRSMLRPHARCWSRMSIFGASALVSSPVQNRPGERGE